MNKFTEKTKELINLIIEELLGLDSGETDQNNKQTFFYYSILYKTIHSLESVVTLIEGINYHQKLHNNISIIIILRTIVSDLIQVEYVSIKEEIDSSKINEIIENIYYNHYRFEKSKISMYSSMYSGDKKFDKVREEFLEYGEQFKDADGNLPKHLEEEISIFKMIKVINSSTKKDVKIVIKSLFEQFLIYSKLVHFGELTTKSIVKDFKDKINKIGCRSVQDSIEIGLMFCIGLVEKVGDKKFNKSSEMMVKYVDMCNQNLCT